MTGWFRTLQLDQVDARVWIIVALAVMEVSLTIASYLTRRRLIAYDVPIVLLLLVPGVLSCFLLEPSELSWAFAAAAAVLWTNGLAVRHQTWVQSVLNFEWRDRLPWVRRLLGIRAVEWYVGSRHPDAVGAVLEGIALLTLTGRWPVILAGSAALCLAAWSAARLTDRKFEAGTRAYFERDGVGIVPAFWPIALVALEAVVSFGVVALVSHERVIFYGDPQAASGVLATAAVIVGSIAVLTITISLVVAQVAAGEVSVRLALYLVRDASLVVTASSLFVAVSICLGLLSRLADFPSTPANSWPIDMALVMCAAAVPQHAPAGMFGMRRAC
jgi:hypothetical protein